MIVFLFEISRVWFRREIMHKSTLRKEVLEIITVNGGMIQNHGLASSGRELIFRAAGKMHKHGRWVFNTTGSRALIRI